MNVILNIIGFSFLFILFIIPLFCLIYLCKRIIKCDKDIKSFILEKNNKFYLIIYILLPPVLWYRLLRIGMKRFYSSITLFLCYWFFMLFFNLDFISKIVSNSNSLLVFFYILLFILFYIIPILFIVCYFLIRTNKQDKQDKINCLRKTE